MDIFKKLYDLENQAADIGFKWETSLQIIQQIQSEIVEVNAHLKDFSHENLQQKKLLQEEIGDLLHAVFSLCVFCKLNPQVTLEKSVDKFERRFNAVTQIAKEQGLTNLHEKSFKELMLIWDKAKQLVG